MICLQLKIITYTVRKISIYLRLRIKMSKQSTKIEVTAKSLIATYIDPLPVLPITESSQFYYDDLRSQQKNNVTVSHFNMIRFLGKFRQI